MMRLRVHLIAFVILVVFATTSSAASLPHLEQISPNVYASGFANVHRNANCGWVTISDQTLLVDLPRGVTTTEFLAEVTKRTGKPIRCVVLTHFRNDDISILESLVQHGVTRIVGSAEARKMIAAASEKIPSNVVEGITKNTPIGDAAVAVDFIPLDQIVSRAGAAVHVPHEKVLFAGSLVVNGPRAILSGSDTAQWVSTLQELEKLGVTRIVPGQGSWGGVQLLERQTRFLVELRRQISYGIALETPLETMKTQVVLPASYYAWWNRDRPNDQDIAHIYGELTVPAAPFNGRRPQKSGGQQHALVLLGDRFHQPEYAETALKEVFRSTKVMPHFTVDVRALSAENLAAIDLLVILRDGMNWPEGTSKPYKIWMTPEQERAVVEFVEQGGAFLNLHNSMGLYPQDGPYLKLVGGRYIGHGPLERFRIEVVDRTHPITRGVEDFSVADEQHTPPFDKDKVHLLLQNRSDDGKVVAAAGWAYEPGRGRLCHLANGHTLESLLHPMNQLLMRNAVAWCLRRDTAQAEQKR